jgi:hypothetical protein
MDDDEVQTIMSYSGQHNYFNQNQNNIYHQDNSQPVNLIKYDDESFSRSDGSSFSAKQFKEAKKCNLLPKIHASVTVKKGSLIDKLKKSEDLIRRHSMEKDENINSRSYLVKK